MVFHMILFQTEDIHTETCDAYFGPKMQRIVFIMNTQKWIAFPLFPNKIQEIQAIQQQLSSTHNNQAMSWPSVHNDPINEYTNPYLATFAFPALFPRW